MSKTIYTIGSSILRWSEFAARLEAASVGCLVDVRSFPRSRFLHFNRAQLQASLNLRGIAYVFLGDGLGGHVEGAELSYSCRKTTAEFLAGIDRVLDIAARCRPALLCAESDPVDCHRCIIVGRFLFEERGVNLVHIDKSGQHLPHAEIEELLIHRAGLTNDLFMDRGQRLSAAYSARLIRMGLAP